ncbi:MAG: recombinase family protein, partial [Anaerolineales bacterium]
SSESQAAADKVSLEVQEIRSRELARQRGWVETAGPYTIPGESRTRYANLSHAEAAMPDLKRMLDDAHDHVFDVLVLYDYDRLRDLLGMVSKTLSHYKVQLFAVNMPVEPVPPAEYNPYKNDMAAMMEAFAMMKQKAQTNDLRRKYQEAMPNRAAVRGLPVKTPFGYDPAPNSKVPPEINKDHAKHLLHVKDMVLSGKSLKECAEYMASSGVAPQGKAWYRQTIKQMLTNPFYAGKIRWGATRSELDPRTGQVKRNRKVDPDTIVWGEGRHEPLWDEATHEAIQRELGKRSNTYKGKTAQALSNLLTCGTCGLRLWVFYNNRYKSEPVIVWRCSSREEHVTIFNDDALRKLAEAIEHDVKTMADLPEEIENEVEQAAKAELDDLKSQRDRMTNAYSLGIIAIDEFGRHKAPLDEKIAELELTVREYIRAERAAKDKRIMLEIIKTNLHALPVFLAGNAQEVNFTLRKILSDITLHEDGELELIWL